MATNDKPKIGLNLDSLEREIVPEPYKFTLGGKVWTCIDPNEADWQDVTSVNINDSSAVLKMFLGDLIDEFAKIRMPMWKVNQLATAMTDHYQVGN